LLYYEVSTRLKIGIQAASKNVYVIADSTLSYFPCVVSFNVLYSSSSQFWRFMSDRIHISLACEG